MFAVVVVAAALVPAIAARADGDPASDFLIISNVSLSYTQPPSHSTAAALRTAVETAYLKHFRVKVAVIATPVDLGSIPSLFNHPAEYAHFLGQELGNFYIGPLLIVMPAGFGIYDGGRATAAEEAVLTRQSVQGADGNALTASATAAVQSLLAAGALRSKDTLAPFPEPGVNVGTRGRSMKLTYNVFEDSGYAAVELQVIVGGRTLATFKTPLRRISPTKTYSVNWQVPASFHAKDPQLCVSARDGSGNHRRSCALIQIH